MVNQHSKGFYFYVEEEKIEIGLAAIPESCRAVVLNLPNGEQIIHQFNGTAVVVQPSLSVTELEELGPATVFLGYGLPGRGSPVVKVGRNIHGRRQRRCAHYRQRG